MKRLFNFNVLVFFSMAATVALGQTGESENANPKAAQIAHIKALIAKEKPIIEMFQNSLSQMREKWSVVSPQEEEIKKELQAIENKLSNTEIDASQTVIELLLARRIELILEVEGLRLREQLLAKQAAKDREAQVDSLQKLIEVKQKKFAINDQLFTGLTRMHERGSVSSNELSVAEMKRLESELELVEAKNQLIQATESSPELSRVSMELLIKQSQLKQVESFIEETKKNQENANKRAELRSKLSSLRAVREAGRSDVLRVYEKDLAERQAKLIWLELELEILSSED